MRLQIAIAIPYYLIQMIVGRIVYMVRARMVIGGLGQSIVHRGPIGIGESGNPPIVGPLCCF